MTGSLKIMIWLGIVSIGLAAGSCLAADDAVTTDAGEATQEQSWNHAQAAKSKQEARTLIQQRAQVRAQQRQDRIASMNWYGMSNSRPNAATTPFTSRYSAVWEMPGGRPYSWNPAWSRPNYVLAWPHVNY